MSQSYLMSKWFDSCKICIFTTNKINIYDAHVQRSACDSIVITQLVYATGFLLTLLQTCILIGQ